MTNKRGKVKFPALDKKYNLKTRQDLIDYDYIDKLTDKEKAFLNSFTEEYVGANFKHKGKKLHKSKTKKKDCFDRNNSRNRDIYTISKANDMLKELDKKVDAKIKTTADDVENQLIEQIDLKSLKKT